MLTGMSDVSKSLSASGDPALQQIGKGITAALEMIPANNGAFTPEAQALLASSIVALGQASGTLDAGLAALIPPPGALTGGAAPGAPIDGGLAGGPTVAGAKVPTVAVSLPPVGAVDHASIPHPAGVA